MRTLPWLGLTLLATVPCFAESVDCDPITTFADGRQPRRVLLVAPSGDDSTGTGTRESPFRTLNRAVREARAGDAIRLGSGLHEAGAYVQGLEGTPEAPIWIGGEPGQERPVIRGGNTALHLSKVRHLVLENLIIEGATQNGVNCDDGGALADPDATRHVVFRNLLFQDIGKGGNQDGLKLSGVDDFHVLDCEFRRTSAGGSGIDMVGCHAGVVGRCRFSDMGSNAIQCKGGSADILIQRNTFINGGQRAINLGGSTGFQFFRPPLRRDEPNAEARRIRVVANFFRGSDTPVAWVGAVDSLVAHNTVIDPQRWVMRILQETTSRAGHLFEPCGRNVFVNNLVLFQRARLRAFVNIGSNTEPGSFEFANNLWYASDDPTRSRPDLPTAEEGALVGLDPQWNADDGNTPRLAASSPARARGRVERDLRSDWAGRCYASPPSIGAYEVSPANP